MNIEESLEKIESQLAVFAAVVGPWLAPLPSAYLVYRAGVKHLELPVGIAFVTASVVELLGLAATSQALTIYQYNANKRKVDRSAPLILAIALVGVYFAGVVSLTVALEVMSELSTFAPALFPILSLAGVGVLALRIDHRQRLADIEEEKERVQKARQLAKEERQNARQSVKAEVSKEVSNLTPSLTVDNLTVGQSKLDRSLEALYKLYSENPKMNPTEAARQMGVSRQTIYNQLGRLEADGRLPGGNGHEKATVEKE